MRGIIKTIISGMRILGKIQYLVSITCVIITGYPVNSQTWLPSFFSDNMVIQQNEEAFFWGKDQIGTMINIKASWGEETSTKTGEDGLWKTKIATPPAGGPFTIIIKGSEEIRINNVLIGEVWLCSGQSNMEMPVKGYGNQPVIGSNHAILNSENSLIRVFQSGRNASLTPQDDAKGNWISASTSSTPDFSAVAYFFGKQVQETLDVPVGLIVTSWGASKIEAWMDAETLSGFNSVVIPDEISEKYPQHSATALFNGMLNPFIGYNLKGMIWYQGESDRRKPEQYKSLFPAMINSWRAKWELGDFPFYFVQIAPFFYYDERNYSALLREVQLLTMKNVENSGMVVTADVGDCENIHPAKKETVGMRLAYWALAKAYELEGIAYSGPVYSSMEVTQDQKIKVNFEFAERGLSSFGKVLNGFEISGEDHVFYPALAQINKDFSVSVWSEKVTEPVAVHYGFSNCIEGTLFNTAGLPASPFRTDSWTFWNNK
jgi:sialate O-acetylesterase